MNSIYKAEDLPLVVTPEVREKCNNQTGGIYMQQLASIEKGSINENDKNRKICVYQEVTYFVTTEFNTGKDFIEVDGEKR